MLDKLHCYLKKSSLWNSKRCPKLGERWLLSILMPGYKSSLVRFKNLLANLIKEIDPCLTPQGCLFDCFLFLALSLSSLGTTNVFLLAASINILPQPPELPPRPSWESVLERAVGLGQTCISITYGWRMGVATAEGVLPPSIAQLPLFYVLFGGGCVGLLPLPYLPPTENDWSWLRGWVSVLLADMGTPSYSLGLF